VAQALDSAQPQKASPLISRGRGAVKTPRVDDDERRIFTYAIFYVSSPYLRRKAIFHAQGSIRTHSFLASTTQYRIFAANRAFIWRAISGGLCSATPIPIASMVTWRSVKIINPSRNLNSWRPVESIPVVANDGSGTRRLNVGTIQ